MKIEAKEPRKYWQNASGAAVAFLLGYIVMRNNGLSTLTFETLIGPAMIIVGFFHVYRITLQSQVTWTIDWNDRRVVAKKMDKIQVLEETTNLKFLYDDQKEIRIKRLPKFFGAEFSIPRRLFSEEELRDFKRTLILCEQLDLDKADKPLA